MGDGPNDKGLSRKHILEGIDASLKRLKTDYVDLLYIHRLDPDTGFEELAEALNDVVRAGKATYLGASSMWTWQFAKLREMQRANGWAQFAVMQNFYNLCYREEEREMIPYCEAEGVALVPWSPMARGFLAGNQPKDGKGATSRGQTDKIAQGIFGSKQDYAVLARVEKLAAKLGVKPAQIALAWVLAKGITSPIIGATKPHHLSDAVAAADIKLTEAQIASLEAPYAPRAVQGHS
jgi:aryl-alcohol dehydrogenase-like predicted oxidoreductase